MRDDAVLRRALPLGRGLGRQEKVSFEFRVEKSWSDGLMDNDSGDDGTDEFE